jgi:hypothetical protein
MYHAFGVLPATPLLSREKALDQQLLSMEHLRRGAPLRAPVPDMLKAVHKIITETQNIAFSVMDSSDPMSMGPLLEQTCHANQLALTVPPKPVRDDNHMAWLFVTLCVARHVT